MSTQTFQCPINIADKDSYSAALGELERQISQIKRQISYFDVYNVVDVVVDKDTFAAKVAALPLNSSLVVNCDESFYNNGELYSRGDIIFKINTGENIHIKSQTGGVYYPSRLTQDGVSFTIEYSYSDASPSNPNGTIDSNGYLDAPASIITATLSKDSNSGEIYSSWLDKPNESGQIVFPRLFTEEESVVQPVIQFFWIDDGGATEQVITEYRLDVDGEYWVVEPAFTNSNFAIKVK